MRLTAMSFLTISRTLLYIVPLLLATVHVAHAQQAEDVRIRFTAFSLKGKLGELSFLSGGKVEKIKVGDYRRSATVDYSGNPELVFFTGPVGRDGVPTGVVARTRIKPNLKQPLLLFAQTGEGYSVVQIEDDPAQFSLGSIRFMNLTSRKHEVHIGIGEDAQDRLRIPALGFRNYRMQEADHGNLRLRIAKQHQGEMKVLRDCRIFPDNSQRYIYFIYQPDPDKPRIQISSLAGSAS
jgi:hypothetical protein